MSEIKTPYILNGEHTQQIVSMIDTLTAAGMTPMLWGKPGVGKTALVEALALRPGFAGCRRVLLGSQEKSDNTGIPSLATLTGERTGTEYSVTRFSTPDWVIEANEADGDFFVFLDELPQADPDVQGTFLTILQSRVMPSGAKIADHVRFIAAGNPTDIVQSGFELIEPLQNRLAHFIYEPPREEWFQGMLDAWGQDADDAELELRRYVVAYINSHGEHLHKPPVQGANTTVINQNAWPSRRSWDNFATAGGRLLDNKDALEMLAISLVGEAVARDFVTTAFRLKSKTPDEIMKDPSCVDWRNSFMGFVALSSVVSAMSDKSDIPAVINVFNVAGKEGPKDIVSNWLVKLSSQIISVGGQPKDMLGIDKNLLKEHMNVLFGKKQAA